MMVGGKPWKRMRGKWQKDRWTGDDEMWEGRKWREIKRNQRCRKKLNRKWHSKKEKDERLNKRVTWRRRWGMWWLWEYERWEGNTEVKQIKQVNWWWQNVGGRGEASRKVLPLQLPLHSFLFTNIPLFQFISSFFFFFFLVEEKNNKN